MENYREMVESLFEKNSNRIIANSSSEHAAVLYETFFSHAEKEIRILCDNLNPDVFDKTSVIEAAKKFVQSPGTSGDKRKLLIGITGAPPPNSKFIAAMKNLKAQLDENDRANLRIFSCNRIMADNKFVNFAVFDSHGYRFEPDSSRCSAIASINDVPFAIKLWQAFDKISNE